MTLWFAVTNDDGAAAEGLAALREELERCAIAHVAFVDENRWSDSGTALRSAGPTPKLVGTSDNTWTFRHTTPSTLACLACGGPAGAPTALIAGVNRGPNIGAMVWHSGTVGAALTGYSFGLPTVAVSLDDMHGAQGDDVPGNWAAPARIAVRLARLMVDSGVRAMLNVNVPNVAESELRGICVATLCDALPDVRIGPRNEVELEVAMRSVPAGSDVERLACGLVTVTSLAGGPSPSTLDQLVAAAWTGVAEPTVR